MISYHPVFLFVLVSFIFSLPQIGEAWNIKYHGQDFRSQSEREATPPPVRKSPPPPPAKFNPSGRFMNVRGLVIERSSSGSQFTIKRPNGETIRYERGSDGKFRRTGTSSNKGSNPERSEARVKSTPSSLQLNPSGRFINLRGLVIERSSSGSQFTIKRPNGDTDLYERGPDGKFKLKSTAHDGASFEKGFDGEFRMSFNKPVITPIKDMKNSKTVAIEPSDIESSSIESSGIELPDIDPSFESAIDQLMKTGAKGLR